MHSDARTGALEPLDFEHLQQGVPELGQLGIETDACQFDPPIDSSDMTPEHWVELAHCVADHYDAYDGFVVLHGTDTMAYTASALAYMLENLTKPVIFTGSQLPIGQLRTDGRENLITAVQIASAHDAGGYPLVPEVAIYFGGRLLRGCRTTKQSAEAFSAFQSFNYPALADAGVDITYHRHLILSRPMRPSFELDAAVAIFSLFPGIREDLVRYVVGAPQVKAVVMRTFGSGNAPQQPWLLRALREATDSGKLIVNISQCVEGTVAMARYGSGYHLQEAGVISGCDATVESAVTKLMYLLAQHPSDPAIVRQLMSRNLRGEITELGSEK